MEPESYSCDLDPDTGTKLELYLFKNVQNVEMIRNNVLTGAWHCALIKPSLILEPMQVAVAANRAVVALKQNSMITRTIFSEILFNLSLSKNISQSLSKFGINEEREMLVCFVVSAESDARADVLSHIQGESCPLSDLALFTRQHDIDKVYKLSNDVISKDGLLDVVISKMVTKNFVSH